MSSTTINWVETTPADADSVALGAGAIRSIQTALRTGLSQEHIWPSSTGLAGGHARGSARMFVGPTSQVSSADTDGRLMLDSTKSRAWYVGSEASFPVGGRSFPEVASAALPAQNHWVLSASTVTMSSTATQVFVPGGGGWGGIFTATMGGVSGNAAIFTNAYCTITFPAPTTPAVLAWNPDGSVYSGTTIYAHVLALSLASY